jgi:hypothetical protein
MSRPNNNGYPIFGFLATLILGVLLGGLFGFSYLASVQPEIIDPNRFETKKDEEPGKTSLYFELDQTVRFQKPSQFQRRSNDLILLLFSTNGERIEVLEADLNAWIEARLRSGQLAEAITAENISWLEGIVVTPETPVFSIAEQKLHVQMPVSLDLFGQKWNASLLVSGTFADSEEGPVWNVGRLTLNSALIPYPNECFTWAKPFLLKALGNQDDIEKIQAAWEAIRKVEIAQSQLLLYRK